LNFSYFLHFYSAKILARKICRFAQHFLCIYYHIFTQFSMFYEKIFDISKKFLVVFSDIFVFLFFGLFFS